MTFQLNLIFNSIAAAAAKSLQSCPTLCDPIDGSPPGSPIPGILQARTLEWFAISFSNAWKVKVKSLSRVRLLATPWTAAYQAPPSMGFSRQEYWSGVPLPSTALKMVENKNQKTHTSVAPSAWKTLFFTFVFFYSTLGWRPEALRYLPFGSVISPNLFKFFTSLWGMRGLSSPTRDQTCIPCNGSTRVLTAGPPGKSLTWNLMTLNYKGLYSQSSDFSSSHVWMWE